MLHFKKTKFNNEWICYGVFNDLYKGSKIKFYARNLKKKNERVMILVLGKFELRYPSFIFCSYPLSTIIRKKLDIGEREEEVLSSLYQYEILGKKENLEMFLLCNTEEKYYVDRLINSDFT